MYIRSPGNVPGMESPPPSRSRRILLSVARIWIPLAIALAGVVLIAIGHGSYSSLANARSVESAAGVSLLLVALTVWMLNWFYRLSVRSNREREVEEEARRHFARTGRWPDEEYHDRTGHWPEEKR
jgi:protein-S-isoprenylcysteine O-methyltransferase Ste14